MNEYRCTRILPYFGTSGEENTEHRQGYYIACEHKREALKQMTEQFPDDVKEAKIHGHKPFTCKFWKEVYPPISTMATP
tara:strand:+ start:1340 stop:1576 length:237 start_codon:yes stop_codon:yes gene_type:complete